MRDSGLNTLVLIINGGVAECYALACKAMQARLPTEEEYEYLSNVGDWNGGVTCTRGKLWAMAGNMVMAPDLPNPSPVRSVSEFPGQDFSYYCVR